jgi:hypothetical protein
MTRTNAMLSNVAFAALLALVTAGTAGCYGEVDEEGPPPGFVATASPVYYEGHPAYWYGNRWYYRDGAGWGAYRSEPGYLRNYRVQGGVRVGAPARRYERRR